MRAAGSNGARDVDLLAIFEQEAQRRLATIGALLDRLEASSGGGCGWRELGESLYREAHTIKGGAALVGREQARTAAAALEAAMRALREGAAPDRGWIARAWALTLELEHCCRPTVLSRDRLADPEGGIAAAPEPAGEEPLLVLCVEDDRPSRIVVERLLATQPGVRLLAAADGVTALSLARQHRPRLVLLDLNIPDMRGEDVLAALKADPATRTAAVVVTSADPASEHAQRLLSLGAAAYLEKPLDLRRVLALIDELAGRVRA